MNGVSGIEINHNTDGWGPVNGQAIKEFDDIPYAHFDKKDKCYRAADFTMQQNAYIQQKRDYSMKRRDELGKLS